MNTEPLATSLTPAQADADARLLQAEVLTEIGELSGAQAAVAEVLDTRPEDPAALSLFAKIKHMRGELSEAVACWAQIHVRAPRGDEALLRISSMVELARDPERGAGEFLAVGNLQLWRKPAAYLELEEAFRLFLARRPEEAQARCDRLARKHLGRDRETYKLAVLAKAWIAERAGELRAAAGILEELGRERGFETDTDRVLFLARVYESLGTAEHLRSAVHVYHHLEPRLEKLAVLGRLASLYRKLGATEEAAHCERRFLEAFLRRMHRPSLARVVRAAAHSYIPLAKLKAIRFTEAEGPADPSARERAIGLVLTGQEAAARELLRAGGEPIDRKYEADLAALRGDVEEAVALYLDSQQAGADDLRVVGWLLERSAEGVTRPIADFFGRRDVGPKALQALAAARREAPLRADLWRQIGALYRLLGQTDEVDRCAERARVLEEAARRRASSVGRALAAAVYHFFGEPMGLIHEVWAERKPVAAGRGGALDEVLGNLTPEMKESVRNTFLSVREYARSKFPHRTVDVLDYSYTYKITKEDEPSGGVSAGLPTALAFLSVLLGRPVPQDVAATGVLVADAHDVLVLRAVGEAEYKVRGACNRNLRMLILPAANRKDLEESPLVPLAVVRETVRYASTLDDAVAATFGDELWL